MKKFVLLLGAILFLGSCITGPVIEDTLITVTVAEEEAQPFLVRSFDGKIHYFTDEVVEAFPTFVNLGLRESESQDDFLVYDVAPPFLGLEALKAGDNWTLHLYELTDESKQRGVRYTMIDADPLIVSMLLFMI